jgi:Fe2+ transport system protein B
MKGKSDNCLNSEYVSGYKLQKMTLVQNGSKEAKSKKEKKELTQSKKLKAKESSEVDIKKDSDVRTVCNQNSKQNQEAETRSKETKADKIIHESFTMPGLSLFLL